MESKNIPRISIIIPVFNTGDYLLEAVDSILTQESTENCETPEFEILIVDDHSTHPRTLEILQHYADLDSRITILKNQRKKGVAGARNTGIMHSQSHWIGFLDSDDIWFPRALALRWEHIESNPAIRWTGAPFVILRPHTTDGESPVFKKPGELLKKINTHQNSIEITRLEKPVKEFSRSCIIGTSTVLIQRSLILEKGMFNEELPRTEDYHLWFKCAFDNDLWMLNSEISFYRIHSESLTHGNAPKFLYEDTMVNLLLKEPMGLVHKNLLMQRFDIVMQDTCYFYRERKIFKAASRTARQWIKKRPFHRGAWKELIASLLQKS